MVSQFFPDYGNQVMIPAVQCIHLSQCPHGNQVGGIFYGENFRTAQQFFLKFRRICYGFHRLEIIHLFMGRNTDISHGGF